MDATTLLSFFDTWFAGHKRSCGMTRLDVATESGYEDDPNSRTIRVTCPTCGNSVSGTIGGNDWRDVIARLHERGH